MNRALPSREIAKPMKNASRAMVAAVNRRLAKSSFSNDRRLRRQGALHGGGREQRCADEDAEGAYIAPHSAPSTVARTSRLT
jgi:hypothetical protein